MFGNNHGYKFLPTKIPEGPFLYRLQLIKIADRAQKKPENISVFRLELSLKQL